MLSTNRSKSSRSNVCQTQNEPWIPLMPDWKKLWSNDDPIRAGTSGRKDGGEGELRAWGDGCKGGYRMGSGYSARHAGGAGGSAVCGGLLEYEPNPVGLPELADQQPSSAFNDGRKYSLSQKTGDDRGSDDKDWRSREDDWSYSRRGEQFVGDRQNGHEEERLSNKRVQKPLQHSDRQKSQMSSTLALSELLCESGENIVKTLTADNQSALKQIFILADKSSENMCLVIEAFSKAVASNRDRQELVVLFTAVFSEPFLSKLLKFHGDMCSVLSQEKLMEFLHRQHQFISGYFKLISFKNTSGSFTDLLQVIRSTLRNRVKKNALKELLDVFKMYDRLFLQINQYLKLKIKETGSLTTNNTRNKLSRMDLREPEEDFRELTTEPSYNDIMSSKKPFVRRNIVIGQYADVHTYLDVQFRLFREDFIRPMREGIHDYIHNTSSGNGNVRIYTDVRVLQVDISHGKYIYSVKLNLSKKFNQETSKRLMGGNLICASDDNFTTFFLALIADQQDNLRQGILDICPLSRVNINFSSTYTIVESTVFFVAYKHVLAALQQISQDSLPLAEHIVYAQKSVELPRYLQGCKDAIYDMTVVLDPKFMKTSAPNSLFNHPTSCLPLSNPQLDAVSLTAGINGWPSCESLKLDQSQLAALHAALTSRLAIIQGPPGTGKTFLGLKIVQTLLHNSGTWAPPKTSESTSDTQLSTYDVPKVSTFKPPILVVCYTNHALDQFLEGMQNFTKKIVRIGGRSKNEEIKKFQVNDIIQKMKSAKKLPSHLVRASASLHRNFCQVEFRFVKLQTQLTRLVNCEGLLRWKFLLENEIIPSQIANQLSEFTYRNWILPKDEELKQTAPLTSMRNWDDHPTSTGLANDAVGKNGDQIWDRVRCASHDYQNQAIDDHPLADPSATDYVPPNAAIFDLLADSVAEQLEMFNDQMRSAIPSSGYEWHKTLLESQISCIERLARVSKVDVHFLKLNENQNIFELCFQDRCLLYTTWKQKLEMVYQEQLNKLDHDSQASPMKGNAESIDFLRRKNQIQGNLAGIRNLKGVIKWDIFISNLIVPLPIAKQLSRHTYLSWILPHDPEIARETILPPMWTVWRNTPELKEAFPSTLDRDAWRDMMIMTRYEISASLCEYVNLDDLKICSDDVEFEVLLENYDQKLAELNYTFAETVAKNRFEALTNEIRREQECLRRVLSVSRESAHRFVFRRNINVHELSFVDRCLLHESWKRNLISKYQDLCRPYEMTVRQLTARVDEIKRARYLHVASQADVVGMTTTGAAEYRSMIQELRPKIVVIEEAAEILEAHVVTALTESCEHLIMIGDHQQLRPSPAVYELATKYGLETSLFERMIKNGIQFKTLEYQHRMRPEISRLLVPSIYPQLKDHESVALMPTVKGISTSVFFVSHHHKEERECDDNKSRSNAHEAEYIMQLARHLVLQGYSTDQITVLTPYSGQLFLLKQKLRELQECQGMHVTIVDNYQGEENDIILLSLVRSNDRGNIGFLNIDNRVCVALSRAKLGLYIIGNLDQLCESSPLWVKIKDSLAETNSVGEALTLYCQNHPDEISYVMAAEGFEELSPEGGCTKSCASTLPQCGHPCPRKCHANDPNHDNAKCVVPCRKKCKLGIHDCKEVCWKPCPPCLEEVNVELSCKHMQGIECHRSIRHDINCSTLVEKEISLCKHVVKTLCSNDPLTIKCTVPCSRKLDCGHVCERLCHVMEDPEHKEYQCKASCSQPSKPCSHAHVCPLKCYEECLPCVEKVIKTVPCGHTALVECNLKMEEYECKIPCERLLKCGHVCSRTCSEECSPCLVRVNKEAKCGHTALVECNLNMEDYKCKLPCKVLRACGHRCLRSCCEVCGLCDVQVQKINPSCGHSFSVNCGSDITNWVCRELCNRLLKCKHKCARRCGRDCGNCQQIVEKTLPKCGHKVKLPCSTSLVDFQCKMLCTRVLKCKHLCPRKCYDKCGGCKLMVEKTIPKCGHKTLVPCESDSTNFQRMLNCQQFPSCEEKCTRKRFNECCDCNETSQKTLPPIVQNSKIVLETGTSIFQCNMMYGRQVDFEPQCPRKCNEDCDGGSLVAENSSNTDDEGICCRQQQQHKLLLKYDDSYTCQAEETSLIDKNTEVIIEKRLPSYNHTIKIECLMSPLTQSCKCPNSCPPSLDVKHDTHGDCSRGLLGDHRGDINQNNSLDLNQNLSCDLQEIFPHNLHQNQSRNLHHNQSRDLHQNQSRDLHQNQSCDFHQNQSCDLHQNQSRDLHQNPSRDLHQNQLRDLHQNQSRDLHQNQSRDLHQNQSRDLHPNQSRDLHQNQPCDLHPNQSRDLHWRNYVGLHQDHFLDEFDDSPNNFYREVRKPVYQDYLRNLQNDASRDLPGSVSRDLPGNVSRDLPNDISRDLPNEVSRDLPNDASSDLANDVSRDLANDVSRDLANDVSRDLANDVSRDLANDVSRDLANDVSRDLANDVSRDLVNDVSHDLANDVSRDLASDMSHNLKNYISRALANDISRNRTNNVSRNRTNDVSRDLTNDVSRDPTHDVSRDLTHNVSRDLTHDVSRDLIHDVSRDPIHDVSRDLTHNVSRDPTHDVSRDLTHNVSRDPTHDVSRDPTHDVSRDLTHDVSRDPTHNVSRDLTHDVSRDLPIYVSYDLPSVALNELSSDAARSMSKHIPYHAQNLAGDHLQILSNDQSCGQPGYLAYDLTNDGSSDLSHDLSSEPDCSAPSDRPLYLFGHQGLDQHGEHPACTVECSAELQCGHRCRGSWDNCKQGRLHEPCGQPCRRSLLCGHRCPGLCSELCLGCSAPCPRHCPHGRCGSKCGDPCPKCTLPCGSWCPHSLGCGKDCGECKCVPCVLACPKTLPCGHACVGYCGDPCPNICRVCNEDQLKLGCLREMAPGELAVARRARRVERGGSARSEGTPYPNPPWRGSLPRLASGGLGIYIRRAGSASRILPPAFDGATPPLDRSHPQSGRCLFVLLTDCGHTVEHDALQASFRKRGDVVCFKRCPLGQEPVYNCPRFNGILLETYKNLQLVSKECANDYMDMDSISNELIDQTTVNQDECFISWHFLRASPLLTAVYSYKSGGRKTFLRQQLSDLHFQTVFFKEVKALDEALVGNADLKEELTQLRKKVLQETVIASSQFRHEVSSELQRIAALSSVNAVRRRALPELEPFLSAIDLHLDPFKAFTPEREWHVHRLLKNCQNIIPDLKIIESKRMKPEVLSVKMFCGRAWIFCPNGHVLYQDSEGIQKVAVCLKCSK